MEALNVDNEKPTKIILVVDDEPVLRSLLAGELRDAGHTVVEASSADEALVYMKAGAQADLLFTDVQMPGSMDGIELSAVLRSEYPHLDIIITSGNANAECADGLGVFIPKPYSFAEAVALAAKIMGSDAEGE